MRFIDYVRRAVTTSAVSGAALALALSVPAPVEASLLNLSPVGAAADLTVSSGLELVYDANTDQLTATVTSGVGNYFPGNINVTNITYSLAATIDAAGTFSSGTVSILGDVGAGTTTLLTGNLTAFGEWLSGGGPAVLEFLFDTTSSDPSLDFGADGGIILSSSNLFAADFSQSFSALGATTSDTFSAPEPASLLLVALGSLGFAARRRRMARR
jgi:hypothetical protein